MLPPGAVLIVGSGQTGVQLADELLAAGRRVYLALGSNGWAPRRYRGRDIFAWLATLQTEGQAYGVVMPTAGELPDPRIRLQGTPQLTGHHGGQDVDLRRMAAKDGLTLLSHLEWVDGQIVTLAPDLAARLRRSEGFFDHVLRPQIDSFLERAGLDAPNDVLEHYPYEPPERPQVDLREEGITTVLWATGYGMDHSWIDAPITDAQGIPRQDRGVSDIPGLYFIGLQWQHSQASATLFGPTIDAPYLARAMGLDLVRNAEAAQIGSP